MALEKKFRLTRSIVIKLPVRDNVHSHLRHTKRSMAVREGGREGGRGGGLSNGRFAWTKWDFCSEVKQMY